MTIYRVQVAPHSNQHDVPADQAIHELADFGFELPGSLHTARLFLIESDAPPQDIQRIAEQLLADRVTEDYSIDTDLAADSSHPDDGLAFEVFYKPGVMDPVALSAMQAVAQMGIAVASIRTGRRYHFEHIGDDEHTKNLIARVIANDVVEDVVPGTLGCAPPPQVSPYTLIIRHIPIRELDDAGLDELSRRNDLFLNTEEMRTIRDYFRTQGREPTDVELETIAQTWSEHCVHKTLRSKVDYTDADGKTTRYANLLKDTVMRATTQLDRDWCLSVFKDNAGVITFDDDFAVCFKVETHNHPSAIEPYGGAATGLGGCIRDPLGTGLGAKPIANTDVFCFAPPDMPLDDLPKGTLHPRKVFRGVVGGVRDYGNRMGIPTVNGAVWFEKDFLANPLVFCGNVGLMPRDKVHKQPHAGDRIVVIGGRTGRDGIHGATFSSGQLTDSSDQQFGHAVQIGNAITEKKLTDVLMQARDHQQGCLYTAITDCGAGGLSSAVGEMGEELGALVDLDTVPLKYQGLRYDEIWISEAQERMVLSVPEANTKTLLDLCAAEDVDATVIGHFTGDGKLHLRYEGATVGNLDMDFLHNAVPHSHRTITAPPPAKPAHTAKSSVHMPGFCVHELRGDTLAADTPSDAPDSNIVPPPAGGRAGDILLQLLSHLNIASKHWVIRQYDHEVQGNSVIKPLVGRANDGPSDAAVFLPRIDSSRGVAVGCGLNPRYGRLDSYQMALHAVDEAIRNIVAVGARPDRTAILDNFCWGDCRRDETMATLVQACQGCYEAAISYGTPFISGKDSLNNEFELQDGTRLAIPGTLLISAIGLVDDVHQCVTMDFKQPGNDLWLIGTNKGGLGGSHYAWLHDCLGGEMPTVDLQVAPKLMRAMWVLINDDLIEACHDCSEGGIAVAIAEMCIAGRQGAHIQFDSDGTGGKGSLSVEELLFGESPSRFIIEANPDNAAAITEIVQSLPAIRIGSVSEDNQLVISHTTNNNLIDISIDTLRHAWQQPLDWQD